MTTVVYGCCVGSWDKVNRYVLPRIGDRPLVALSGQTSIAQAYNAILRVAIGMVPDMLVLLHDDLEITDPNGETKLLEAVSQSGVGLAGVAGGGGQSLSWWGQSPIGHQTTDVMHIDFGRREGQVELLEGSLLAFSPWALRNLRFKHDMPGFHGYDEIARLARSLGRTNLVVDVDTHHHTKMGFKSHASRQDWIEADRIYRETWT